jgi:hypothetical protein
VDRKLVVAGVTGGGLLAFFITIFSFFSAAPWTQKTEFEAYKLLVAKDIARLEAAQEQMATKQDVTLLLEMMREIKQDVKDIKRPTK